MPNFNMWMPLYTGDYLKKTLGLTRKEHGSYFLLIMAYWNERKPLPDNDEYLMSIALCPESEWPKTRESMLRFFKIKDGFWTHNRIDEELAKSEELYTKKVNQTEGARLGKAEKAVKSIVTSIVTENVTERQSQPQSPNKVLMEFPDALRTARVINKWSVWMNFRRGMRKPANWIDLFNEQIGWLSKYTEEQVFEILSSSIRNGYQGLFEPKNANNPKHNSQRIDRSIGTANEGKAAQYRNLGRLVKPEPAQ